MIVIKQGQRWPAKLFIIISSILCLNEITRIRASELDLDQVEPGGLEVDSANEAKQQIGLKQKERLTIVAPKFLRPQSDYHVLVNLANSQIPTSIDLQITGARDSNREQTEAKSVLINSGETQTLKFSIGDWPPAEYTLSVNAQAVDRSWNYTDEAVLTYRAKSFSGFIQTDKAIYKPGQLVQLRAIFLTQNLVPLTLKEEINVTISNPKRNIVKQWKELSNYRGLLSLELQLSEDPMLGDWTILVEARNQEIKKQFTVAEYILPTYDVNIQLPSYATFNDSNIVATVKASYTYGKPVNGHVTLTVQPLARLYQIDTRPLNQNQYRARLVNGTADISVNVGKDLKLEHDLFERDIEFFALVEDLTGRKYNKTEVLKLYEKSIKIEQINGGRKFKPGLSYLLQLKVAYQDDTPVEDNGPELELKFRGLGKSIENVRLRPVGGVAEYIIEIPKKVKVTYAEDLMTEPTFVSIEATYRKQHYNLEPLYAQFTDSMQFMEVKLPQLIARNRQRGTGTRAAKLTEPSVNVDDELKVAVRATEGMQQVTCQGLARGDIVWALTRDTKNATEFEFSIRIDQKMTPESRILCFYVRPENKELIVDSVRLTVNGLMRNPVKVSTSREEAKPGQEVEVSVLSKPNSLVGVLGIDQSVLLLKSGNDLTQEDVAKEIKSYGSDRESEYHLSTNTANLFDESDVVVLTNNLVYDGFGYRQGRRLYSNAVFRKAQSVQPLSAISLDNLLLERDNTIVPLSLELSRPVESKQPVIRSVFPETWLWENATAGPDGSVRIRSKIPDTITSWALSAFSINEASGFGLTGPRAASVRVFRPFFVKLDLPYSIIRGETVSIQAVVFNYAKRSTSAKVTLENKNGDFDFVEAANNLEDEKRSSVSSESRLVRIPAEDGVSVSFLITPRKLGHIDIRVVAQSEFAGDGLVRKLLVKPEGQTQHFNKAMLLNLEGPPATTFSKNFTIDVPVNAVPGSQKVFVSAVGDIMGPGLSNVDDLLRLPYGCGEQNMVNLVPNIVILNYLQSSGRLKENQRSRAVRNIETGYQRQLNYKRSDGSFSAFGESDKNGSVWLTAYVLKTLQQAKSVAPITIDERVVRRAANFIARFSRPDGSIEEVGMIHDKRLQSVAANSASTYLTAYSMIALAQRPIPANSDSIAPVALDEVLEKGLNYLEGQLDDAASSDNPYNLAIIAYALQVASRKDSKDRAYDQLWSKAQEMGELTFWSPAQPTDSSSLERELESATSSTKPPPLKPIPANTKHSAHLFLPDSLSIEMTALALLTTVKRGDLDRALPIVKWLIAQQNSNGGFASTQDTVLAIEALATFAALTSKKQPSIDVEFLYPRTGSGRQRSDIRRNDIDQILITSSNALVHQQTRLPDNITWVQIQATGSGPAVLQVSWQYNLMVSAERPAFYLNPILDKTSNINYLQLSVCTFYKAGEASNMAVMEVELPSGYVADVDALPGLTRAKEIKRVDTTDGDTKVIIYIDKLTRDELCLTVPAHRTSKVSNNKPVPVSIYDYYNRQHAARIFYEPESASSCELCDPSTECSNACSKKPKKSEKLVSLHEQRHARIPGSNSKKSADYTATQGPGSGAASLLPLAPVLVALMALVRPI